MKRSASTLSSVMPLLLLVFVTTQLVWAQGYDTPLTFQGLSRMTNSSVLSRSAGGIMVGTQRDISLMFAHPASLMSVKKLQFYNGWALQSSILKQDQRFGGIQSTSAFAPLVEGTTESIKDPDTSAYYNGTKVTLRSQADSVQRPFDNIGPDWTRSKSKSVPINAFAALPFTLADVSMVVGVGAVEYANLGWYYQNNNCFSPPILSVAEIGTIGTAGLDRNPFPVQWYQYYQQRDGSIYGYGAALSAALNEQLSVGVSGMLLKGSTDDLEVRVGRGRMLFFTSSMRLDRPGTTSYRITGTSDYSGVELGLSAEFKSQYFEAAVSIKPPTTITRSYSSSKSLDSVAVTKVGLSKQDSIHVYSNSSISGEDEMLLPWRGTFGFGLKLRENLRFGISYEVRPYASAEYTNSRGAVSTPWLSSSALHIGGEYRAAEWLVIRGGVTNYAEVFQPVTGGIRGQPVTYPVYALGATIRFAGTALNLAYEYSDMKYIDTWVNAASINREIKNTLVASFAVELQ